MFNFNLDLVSLSSKFSSALRCVPSLSSITCWPHPWLALAVRCPLNPNFSLTLILSAQSLSNQSPLKSYIRFFFNRSFKLYS